jgi:hypothetical protein
VNLSTCTTPTGQQKSHPEASSRTQLSSRSIIPLRGESLTWPPGPCSKVIAQALCAWLADMELSTDGTDRGNPVSRKLFSEHLGGLFLQLVRTMPTAGRGVLQYLRTADDHHEEFVRTHQGDRWPCGHRSTYRPVS